MTVTAHPPAGTVTTRSQTKAPRLRWLGRTLWRVETGDPAWVRPSVAGLLLATALLYLWGLGASGWANSFYSAAAQAGSQSWKALFYGSSDAGNSITVDKTPASLWVMAMSVRIFGLSSWSILVPQALAGVASVGVLYATVRRWFGPAAGLVAGAVLATTPVATLMFRFNNPDALLVLLLVFGAYATVRAVETASTRWLVIAGAFVGFGFLTKMLQAFLVLPAFAAAYLLAAPTNVRRRVTQVLYAGLAAFLAAGWWVAIMELVPARYRPYIGGSQNNSVLELTLGYNGLGRITGNETGSVGGGMGWGQTGWSRLFAADIGGQVAWLLPAALLLLGAGFAVTWRQRAGSQLGSLEDDRPSMAASSSNVQPGVGSAMSAVGERTSIEAVGSAEDQRDTARARAAFVLWGGWLVVTGLTFSFMQGIFHAYYTVALAPAIGALVAMGSIALWRRRQERWTLVVLAATLGLTAIWSAALLDRSPDWHPWLRDLVLVAGLAGAGLLVLAGSMPRLARAGVLSIALLAALGGPLGYSLTTAATAHTGAIPSAGPAVAAAGFGRPGGFGPAGGFAPGATPGNLPGNGASANTGGQQGAGQNGGPTGGPPGGFGGGGQGQGGGGGLLDAGTPSADLVALLKEGSSGYRWTAAAIGSNNAAGYQLASGAAVMAIGGFNGSDPSPTLAQFRQYVAEGKIHYFLGGGTGGFSAGGGSQVAQEIASWIEENFTATTVGGTTVYDLSGAGSATEGGSTATGAAS